MPLALDQEGPAPTELSASSGFVVAHCFAIPRRRASPAGFVAAVAAASSDFAVTTCFAILGGRTPPTDFVAVVAAALVVPIVPDQDDHFTFAKRLCHCEPCRGALRNPWRPSFTNSLNDCCNAATVPAICSGPRRPVFTRGDSDFGVCRGTLLRNLKRPSFTNRLCACCIDSFSSCRGTQRPTFGNRSYICCSNGCAGRATVSGPR